jgi:carboxyl-terminal processing protease
VTDKIKVKIAPAGPAPDPLSGTATIIRDDVALRETVGDGALVVGRAAKGTTFKTSGRLGNYTRVDIDGTRFAFVASADVKSGGPVHGALVPEWQVTPPVLTVTAPTVATGDTVHIGGHAVDDHLVRDVFVRVWNRNAKIPVKKAFYQPNRLMGDRTKMDFEADIPLGVGSNLVQVFARESNEVQSMQTVVVLRRAPGASIVAQPVDATAGGASPVNVKK